MTLEERLMTYDWEKNFQIFADATRVGTFKPLCSATGGSILPEPTSESHYPRIIWPYSEPKVACTRKPQRNKLSMLLSEDGEIGGVESDESNAVERGQLVRNKVSRSSDMSTSTTTRASAVVVLVMALLAAVLR